MLAPLTLFPSPQVQPALGRALSEEFLAEFGPPALLTMPMGDERAYDFGFNGNHGALTGGVTTTGDGMGVLSQGWNLNGTTGYISFAANPLNVAADLSLTLALNANPATQSNFFGGYDPASPFNGLGIRVLGTAPPVLQTWDGASWKSSSYSFPKNTDCVVTLSVSSGVATFYINGVAGGSPITLASRTNWTGAAAIGARADGAALTLGTFYAAIGFNQALSADQVSSLYSSLLYGDPFPLFEPSIFNRFYSLPAGGGSLIFQNSFESGMNAFGGML